MTDENRSTTTAQLRNRIDEGKAGDKVGFPDPAAAPLGTDDEAGGQSPTAAEVEWAHRHEIDSRPASDSANADVRPVDSALSDRRQSGGRIGNGMIIAGVVTALVGVLIVLSLW